MKMDSSNVAEPSWLQLASRLVCNRARRTMLAGVVGILLFVAVVNVQRMQVKTEAEDTGVSLDELSEGSADISWKYWGRVVSGVRVREGNATERRALLNDLASDYYDSAYLRSFSSPFIIENPEVHSGSLQNLTTKDSSGSLPLKHITWTRFPPFLQQVDDHQLFGHCPVQDCRIHYQATPSVLKQTDALLFTWQTAKGAVPARTKKNQMYVFSRMESPLYTNFAVLGKSEWNRAFNLTMHYRLDSDIWVPVGTLRRVKDVPPLSVFEELAKQKSKDAAWTVSNCNSMNERTRYIHRLMSQIPVDIYGKCGTFKCGPFLPVDKCLTMLTPLYRFYLSFENAYCSHYVTEKFFKVFKKDVYVVPVVRGGVNYARYFPQGTYIDADWFSSPEELGRFLRELMQDTKTYAKMLWRRAHFAHREHGMVDAWCQLCDWLHRHQDQPDDPDGRHSQPSSAGKLHWYSDLAQWYAERKCVYHAPF